MVFRLEKCCFCIELRTGCLIIGYLNLIVSLIFLVVIILGAAGVKVVKETLQGVYLQSTSPTTIAIKNGGGILLLIGAIALLVGVYLNKHVLVQVYLLLVAAYILIHFIKFIDSLIFGYFNVETIMIDIFSILSSIYFFLVTGSYYEVMHELLR